MKYNQVMLVTAFSSAMTGAALAQAPASAGTSSSQTAETADALAAMEKGDNWLATNTLRRAVEADGSVVNRFNLATGYQRTNRLIEARQIYAGLIVDGADTQLTSSSKKGVIGGQSRLFRVGDEAASRLAYIAWRQGAMDSRPDFVATSTGGAPSADLAGVAVSATVPGDHEVSDARARELDAMARND